MTLNCLVNWLRLHGCCLLGLPYVLMMVGNLILRDTPRLLHDCNIKPETRLKVGIFISYVISECQLELRSYRHSSCR